LTAKHPVATPANWKKGEDVIVNFPLTDSEADEKFKKNGYKIIDLPSEQGKQTPKHYLRYTKDPVNPPRDRTEETNSKTLSSLYQRSCESTM